MPRMLILSPHAETGEQLASGLLPFGFTCSAFADAAAASEGLAALGPELVLMDLECGAELVSLAHSLRASRGLPTLASGRLETISSLNGHPEIDDFVSHPVDLYELAIRAHRLARKSSPEGADIIRRGDLVIDTGRCEVTVSGRPVMLTFKEYQLLRFLAMNAGRVFTRETLLDRVWGQDYLGGDRTVDVHVRRLRSKIEDPAHSFIDTVRNMGYSLRSDAGRRIRNLTPA